MTKDKMKERLQVKKWFHWLKKNSMSLFFYLSLFSFWWYFDVIVLSIYKNTAVQVYVKVNSDISYNFSVINFLLVIE